VPPEAEAAVVGVTVERRSMTYAAAAAAVVQVKGALEFVEGKRSGSVGVEPRDTVGAC